MKCKCILVMAASLLTAIALVILTVLLRARPGLWDTVGEIVFFAGLTILAMYAIVRENYYERKK